MEELDTPPPVPAGVMEEERNPEKFFIEDLGQIREYIDAIDFELLIQKLTNQPGLEGGLGWSQAKARAVERQYKNWIYLRRKYLGEKLPPSPDIDQFWHAHMLDTRAYHRDCARIFGTYHHHYPYFGARGDSDKDALMKSWERVLELYRREYGVPIYQVRD
ncbi:glycine-rich domain-containing protein [Nocardia xishanensis]